MSYRLDAVFRRYGVWPGSVDLHDPAQLRWMRRALIFESLEADQQQSISRRQNRQPLQLRETPIEMPPP